MQPGDTDQIIRYIGKQAKCEKSGLLDRNSAAMVAASSWLAAATLFIIGVQWRLSASAEVEKSRRVTVGV